MAKFITFTHKGNFKKLDTYFGKAKKVLRTDVLDKYGRKGVEALKNATPVRTGLTASSWSYEVKRDSNGATIIFSNSNVIEYTSTSMTKKGAKVRNNKIQIAIILQYGHGTGTGGYVQGIDYINPALQPVFEEMADSAWKEVTRL